eukprot:bmy_07411T0
MLLPEKLSRELLEAFHKRGPVIKRKHDTHRRAEANRARGPTTAGGCEKKKTFRLNRKMNVYKKKILSSPQCQAAWRRADVLKSGERKMQFLLLPNEIQESITERIACQAGNSARLQLWPHLHSGPPPSPEFCSKARPQVSALRKRQLGKDPVLILFHN